LIKNKILNSQFFKGLGIVSISFVLLTKVAIASDGTQAQIKKIEADAYGFLMKDDFASLNAMAGAFNNSKERLPDGRWKLTFVFSNLTSGIGKHDEAAWKARLELIDKWISKSPNDSTPYIAKADALTRYAWDARGGGYADTVEESDWVVFKKRIADARTVLESAPQISKNSPLWYDAMQTVALAQAWTMEQYGQLFQEAVKREPTYYFLYFNAATYFLPRWHGDAKEIARFVEYAVESSKAKEGQTLYARIYWSLLWALGDNTFSPGNAQWPRMRQGFRDIVKSYPDNWNINAFAYYACMANDLETVAQIAPKITTMETGLWQSPSRYTSCLDMARKFSKPS
jgi:hypothetical protein